MKQMAEDVSDMVLECEHVWASNEADVDMEEEEETVDDSSMGKHRVVDRVLAYARNGFHSMLEAKNWEQINRS